MTARNTITLRNDFHNSEITLRPTRKGTYSVLSARQVRRARKALCGLTNCTCGGPAGERGPQSMDNCRCYLEEQADGSCEILAL